jgi:hypothetical protein
MVNQRYGEAVTTEVTVAIQNTGREESGDLMTLGIRKGSGTIPLHDEHDSSGRYGQLIRWCMSDTANIWFSKRQ